MKISIGKLSAIITLVMVVTGGLVTSAIQVYDWTDKIATKDYVGIKIAEVNKQIVLASVSLRISDVEDSIKFYQMSNIKLDQFGRDHYAKLQKRLFLLESERNVLNGISVSSTP